MIDDWLAEIAAMPMRKRRQWKGHLKDKWGVKQRVRYTPEGVRAADTTTHFEVYEQANRESFRGWQPVVVIEEVERNGSALVPMGRYGPRLLAADDMFEEVHQIQGETHTGNHYRTHTIKVPTAAGEPVRA